MVRIVNGVVVDDDDPRARQSRDRPAQAGGFGRIRHRPAQEEGAGHRGQAAPGGPAAEHHVSPLATANEKLLALGIPRLEIAGYQLEPLVLVGFVLAFILMGPPGLLFGIVLFYLHHTQTQRANPVNAPQQGVRQQR